MRKAFFILTLFTTSFAYSQKKLSYIGRLILEADSVFIYASPKNSTTNLSDTSCCNMLLYKDSFNISFKLTLQAKTELGNILIKPSGYVGRYASRSGFDPTEILAFWRKGKIEYIKISRSTHDIFYSQGLTWIFIDPIDVDKIEMFYRKYKLKVD